MEQFAHTLASLVSLLWLVAFVIVRVRSWQEQRPVAVFDFDNPVQATDPLYNSIRSYDDLIDWIRTWGEWCWHDEDGNEYPVSCALYLADWKLHNTREHWDYNHSPQRDIDLKARFERGEL